MNALIVAILAGVVAVETVTLFALIVLGARAIEAREREIKAFIAQIDRVLLLGKSSTVGEGIAAFERMSRIERAREEALQQAAEAEREKVRAGMDPGKVAENPTPGRNWLLRHRPPRKPVP
jgi:hypothetical protein